MPEKNKKNILKSIFGAIFLLFSFLGVNLGLTYFLRLAPNKSDFYWDFILLSFVVGTLILTMRPDYLNKKWREPYPRLGFIIILSGIFVLIGNGISLFSLAGSNVFIFLGIIMFSAGLSSLLTILGSHLIVD